MSKTITILLAVVALTLSVSAQEQTKKAISAEFAKAANLALVAVKNSDSTAMCGDKTGREAINTADAVRGAGDGGPQAELLLKHLSDAKC
jgi:hypothetical protein